MPSIIPVGFGEASIVLTSGAGTAPYVTTIGVNLVGLTGPDYVNAANNIMAAYANEFDGQISNEIYLDHVTIQVGLSGGGSGSIQSDLAVVQGGNTGDMAPLAMAPIARKLSADLGRRGKGRCFIPCVLNRADVDEAGNLVPSTLASYQAKWQAFLVALATNEVGFATAPVLLHADGSTPTPITGGSVAPKVGWIRKRIR